MIYAVNKRTKEHLVHGAPSLGRVAPCPEWYYVQADADGWIEWHGGECPLPDNHPYEVKCETNSGIQRAAFQRPQANRAWSRYWLNNHYNIIAYRPIFDNKPQAPEWDGEGLPPVGAVCEVKHIGVWHQTTIVGVDEGLPVFKTDWCQRYAYACGADFQFRPIRTDRERWIKAASEVARKGLKNGDMLGYVYDAGLAKMPGE